MTVDTDLTISGKVAQFGSTMIKQVSEKLLGEFTTCLESKLVAGVLSAGAEASAGEVREVESVSPDEAAGGPGRAPLKRLSRSRHRST